MKINKKLVAGALALAMGVSAMAPAYAADTKAESKVLSAKELINRDFEKVRDAFIAEVVKAEKLKASIPEKEKAVKDAEKEEKELNEMKASAAKIKAAYDLKATIDEAIKKITAEDEKTPSLKEFKGLLNAKKVADEDFEGSELHDKVNKWDEKTDKQKEEAMLGQDKDKVYAAVGLYKATKVADKAVEDFYEKSQDENIEAKIKVATKKVEDAKKALNYAKGYDESHEYKEAKAAFIAAGGAVIDVHAIEIAGGNVDANKIKPSEDKKTSVDEQIKATAEKLQKKLDALKLIKETMKETYKRNAKIIDAAIEQAEAALKLVQPKSVSLFSVAYAAEEEAKDMSKEDVLKALNEADTKADEALKAVEEDSKAQNEADAKKEEAPKTEENKKNKENKENKEEVKVEKKEDMKASSNVKTGVAGVAGVAAVLAAASAAYVSTKRN